MRLLCIDSLKSLKIDWVHRQSANADTCPTECAKQRHTSEEAHRLDSLTKASRRSKGYLVPRLETPNAGTLLMTS